MIKTYIFIAIGFLIVGLFIYFFFKRNYFNKHKYIRLERYNEDKSLTVRYYKREKFNEDQKLLINPEHVFNFKGYTTFITNYQASETINPLDFKSKYNKKMFTTAITTKLVSDTFATRKKPKVDMLMVSVALNGITLMLLLYLFLQNGGIL